MEGWIFKGPQSVSLDIASARIFFCSPFAYVNCTFYFLNTLKYILSDIKLAEYDLTHSIILFYFMLHAVRIIFFSLLTFPLFKLFPGMIYILFLMPLK